MVAVLPRYTLRNTLPIALFLFLFAVYLLTYTPRINSSDGLAMFATAESLVRRGALDIEQIRWLGLQQGTYGLDGLLYSRKGIGLPIGLLPLTWLGLIIPWFGTVGLSLLFNAIVTALTAALLLAYLEQLGIHRRTGLMVALIFGLATLAWPYAKSLFSDPFSGLLLLAAAYTLLKFQHSQIADINTSATPLHPRTPALLYPFLAGLFLGWNVATRYAEALFVPVFGLLLLYYLFTIHNSQFTIHHSSLLTPHSSFLTPLLAFTLPLLLIGLALIGFNIARYGDPFNTGYLPNETFSAVLWEGMLGQLISPGRGLLLYSPILILSLGGVVPFFRRCRAEAIVALGVIIIHLLLYGKWFMWHGGYAWGPRFMIPTLPFWTLFLAPAVERIFPKKSPQNLDGNSGQRSAVSGRLFRLVFLILVILSLIPQFLGVAIDFAPFQNSLLDTGLPLFARQTFFDSQYSPLIGAWAFIRPDSLDLAWAWQGEVNGWLLLMLVANIALTGLYLMHRWGDSRRSPTPKSQIPNLLPLLSTAAATIFLLAHVHTLPPQLLQESIATLNEAVRPADAIITNDPEIATPLAELYKGRAPVLGLNHGGFPLPDDVTSRLNETIANHRQIWWLPNWLPPEESAVEQILLANTLRVRNQNFGDRRLVLFVHPPDDSAATHTTEHNFDTQIKLLQATYPPQTQPGAALPIELRWQAVEPIDQDYHIFIHLLDDGGQTVAQADGQPAQWTRPTSTWAVGETIIDQHGLWIPAEAAPETYRLRVGVYHPRDGRRLQLPNGQDSAEFELRVE